MQKQPNSRSVINRHRIGRHNSPAYVGAETQEPGATTPYAAAQEATTRLGTIAGKTGLSIRCIIECHRTMTKMGRTAHVPAGTRRCRDIAQHRLAQAIQQDPADTAISRHRRECLETAATLLGHQATPAQAIILAKRISDGAIHPSEAPQPTLMAKCRNLAAQRTQYPPGIWNDLDQCGQQDLPSDAMLARIITSVAKAAGTNLTQPETHRLYQMLKENLP